MTATPQMNDAAAEWHVARLLYPLYLALAGEFVIDLEPCAPLEADGEAPSEKTVEIVRQWFSEMDQRIQVQQLRQFLQTTSLASEEGLRAWMAHYLRKAKTTAADRDKIDFLSVQYFSHCVPSGLEYDEVDLKYVAQVLEPVLGKADLKTTKLLHSLDKLIQTAKNCASLKGLLSSGVLEKGRKLKAEDQLAAITVVAFTRYSFLIRRIFFHLMHQDLHATMDGLRELERRGITTLDCRQAQFSADEPTSRLRMICQSWKVMFRAEYSSGQPLRMLVDLRSVVDGALANTATQSSELPAPHAKAAAASAGSGSAKTGTPEFEVTTGSDSGDDPA